MADATYQLSSVDQSTQRIYLRYGLCFPCNDEQKVREQIAANLKASVKRAISYMPILAGDVYPIQEHEEVNICDSAIALENPNDLFSIAEEEKDDKQRGRMEVRVREEQVIHFEPTINVLTVDDFPHTYEDLDSLKAPASVFVNDALTPLPDAPDSEAISAPAFAVQANFITGGIIVSLYLHHSVADVKGLAAVIRHMSISEEMLPGVQHTQQSLKNDALEQSRMRDRLSGSRGVKADLEEHPAYDVGDKEPHAPPQGNSCILTFSMEMLDGTKDVVNERWQYINEEPGVNTSTFDCLVAVLWKAIARARLPTETIKPEQKSRIFVSIDMAKRLDPPLPEQFYGNSCLFSCIDLSLVKLTVPFEVGCLARTSRLISEGDRDKNDTKARSAIAIINEQEDVMELTHPNIDFSNDLVIADWAHLPVEEESTLGLGLGPPAWAREVGRGKSAYGCVLLPPKKTEGVWEVLVQLTDDEMERLQNDAGLQPFLLNVA